MRSPDLDGFEWDEEKSARCLQERGFDFGFAAKVFDGGVIEWEDQRAEYGEQRFITIGEADGRFLAVVWTPRGTARRVISARPASLRERQRLNDSREAYQQTDP